MNSFTSSKNSTAPLNSGQKAEPASEDSTARLPPSSGPCARPPRIVVMRSCVCTRESLRSRSDVGLARVAACASITTLRKLATLNSFHSDVPIGLWKVMRPVWAWMALISEVRSLKPPKNFGLRRISA